VSHIPRKVAGQIDRRMGVPPQNFRLVEAEKTVERDAYDLGIDSTPSATNTTFCMMTHSLY
jgi:hypothetical protein